MRKYVGLIYGQAGAGKTVNACRVAGNNLLLCGDHSSVSLNMFPEISAHTEVQEVYHWTDRDPATGIARDNFIEQFNRAVETKKYDNIIIDNLTNLFDLAILELAELPKHDARHDYLIVYQQLKRLAYKANEIESNVIFNAWEVVEDVPTTDGTMIKRVKPHLPIKITDQILGLCQVVGRVNHAIDDKGVEQYYFDYRGSQFQYGKDQIFGRKTGMPENIFDGKDVKK